MADFAELVEGHLSELVIEALATQRDDLVGKDALAHRAACDACAQRVSETIGELAFVSTALRVDLSDAALDALVCGALETTQIEPVAAVVTIAAVAAPAAAVFRPSRGALFGAALLAAAAAIVLGVLSLDGLPSIGGVLAFAHDVRAVGGAIDRLVSLLVPGGWGALALLLSLLLGALLVPLRVLLGSGRARVDLLSRVSGLTLGVWLAVGFVPRAQALDFVGDWPADEHLTVVAANVPASVALERAAQAAGLGFVGALAVDPPTHLRVRDASLREVVRVVLGNDAALVAERTSTLLIVRRAALPAATAVHGAATPVIADVPNIVLPSANVTPQVEVPAVSGAVPRPPPPAVQAASPPPVSALARRDARDRASFGGNVVVSAGEVVASVVTMGGNATIDGVVLGDVVTMGGGAHVRRSGVVHGEIVAMGGEVRVDEGALAPQRVQLTAMPDGIAARGTGYDAPADDVDDAAAADDDQVHDSQELDTASAAATAAAGALAEWLSETFASASRHALLFLFGLLLLGTVPARLDALTRAVAALPVRAAVTGFVAGLAGVILAVVLVITIVGIPGAVVLGLSLAVGTYAGLVAVAAVIGRILPIRALDARPVLQLAAGVLVLFVVARVPVLGGLASFVAAMVGLGAVVATRAGTRAA